MIFFFKTKCTPNQSKFRIIIKKKNILKLLLTSSLGAESKIAHNPLPLKKNYHRLAGSESDDIATGTTTTKAIIIIIIIRTVYFCVCEWTTDDCGFNGVKICAPVGGFRGIAPRTGGGVDIFEGI